MSDVCQVEGCDTWIGRPRQIMCDDCKRKLKRIRPVRCAFQDCLVMIPSIKNRRYCVKHTALHS
jgi:hypothetical protein